MTSHGIKKTGSPEPLPRQENVQTKSAKLPANMQQVPGISCHPASLLTSKKTQMRLSESSADMGNICGPRRAKGLGRLEGQGAYDLDQDEKSCGNENDYQNKADGS